jgi:hypothetical protein
METEDKNELARIEACLKHSISMYFDVPEIWKQLVIQDNILNDADWIAIVDATVDCLISDCPTLTSEGLIALRVGGKTFQDLIYTIALFFPYYADKRRDSSEAEERASAVPGPSQSKNFEGQPNHDAGSNQPNDSSYSDAAPEADMESGKHLNGQPENNSATSDAKLGLENAATEDEEYATAFRQQGLGDSTLGKDALGFETYVEAMARFLTNEGTQNPLTLSIEGEWGTGKSFFLRLLKDQLEYRGKIVVSFNAWRHDKDKELWSSFAIQFMQALARKTPFWKRIWGYVMLAKLRYSWKDGGWLDIAKVLSGIVLIVFVAFLIPWFGYHNGWETISNIIVKLSHKEPPAESRTWVAIGSVTAYFAALFEILKRYKTWLTKIFEVKLQKHLKHPDYEANASFIEDFHRDFGKIVKAFAQDSTVYVLVDDLDRCEVPKAADLMQALNLMISDNFNSDDTKSRKKARVESKSNESIPDKTKSDESRSDKANLVFVLAMDRAKVAASIAVKQEKALPYLIRNDSQSDTDKRLFSRSALEFGYNFIEKFIQLPFQLPIPNGVDIDKFIETLCGKETAKRVASRRGMLIEPLEVSDDVSIKVKRENVEEAARVDSPILHALLRASAPLFQSNPRRMKQFINQFRLRAYIVAPLVNQNPHGNLTLAHVGKLIAITMHWPTILGDIQREPKLLAELQAVAHGKAAVGMNLGAAGVSISRIAIGWAEDKELIDYLGLGIYVPSRANAEPTEIHSDFSNTDILSILRFAPQIKVATSGK